MGSWKCKHCGTVNTMNDSRCSNCGEIFTIFHSKHYFVRLSK